MTVALKCEDRSCCTPPKTIISNFFPGRRVPTLIPFKHTQSGPVALPLTPDVVKEELTFLDIFQRLALESILLPPDLKTKYNMMVPYDVYFPTLQHKVEQRVCKTCGKYFALKLSLKEHKQVCSSKRNRGDDGFQAKKRIKIPNVVAALEVDDEFFEGDDEEEDQNLEDSIEAVLEVNAVRSVISVPAAGGIETIVNLKEWLKSPYQLISDLS